MDKGGKKGKYFRGTPEMAHLKGELVDEKEPRDFAPDYGDITLNPLKTPPNNLTAKDKTREQNG